MFISHLKNENFFLVEIKMFDTFFESLHSIANKEIKMQKVYDSLNFLIWQRFGCSNTAKLFQRKMGKKKK